MRNFPKGQPPMTFEEIMQWGRDLVGELSDDATDLKAANAKVLAYNDKVARTLGTLKCYSDREVLADMERAVRTVHEARVSMGDQSRMATDAERKRAEELKPSKPGRVKRYDWGEAEVVKLDLQPGVRFISETRLQLESLSVGGVPLTNMQRATLEAGESIVVGLDWSRETSDLTAVCVTAKKGGVTRVLHVGTLPGIPVDGGRTLKREPSGR
jgi:hypothetical protein